MTDFSDSSSYTVEDMLRRSLHRCLAVAYLCGSREGLPSPDVWSGIQDLFVDLAVDLVLIVKTMPVEDANATPR